MEQRLLGSTGIKTSVLGLGTVKFGRNEGVKYPSSFAIPEEGHLSSLLSLAKDLGINTIDTAPAYGTSEERLGRLLKGQRQDWVIIGKAGEEFEHGQSRYDFTPHAFEASLLRSLKRLQTDYLDVFLIHSDGRDLEILNDEELVNTLLSFRARGLVRALGASTKTAEGGIKALKLFDAAMVTYTPEYSDEKPALDYAATQGKGIILKKALSSGHSDDPGQALRFGLNAPAVSCMIVGTINPDHLKANAQACLPEG